MDDILQFLGDEGETELPCVVEGRGRNEDAQLERAFYKLMTTGTDSQPRERYAKLSCPLVFRSKRDNIAGIQLADLCAHPCARYVLKPDQANRAYNVAKKHIYKKGDVYGWKIVP